MLQAILRFCSLEETLVVDAMAALARRRANRMDMEERTKVRGSTLAQNNNSSSLSASLLTLPSSIPFLPPYFPPSPISVPIFLPPSFPPFLPPYSPAFLHFSFQ